MNTKTKTVVGVAQGESKAMEDMKHWLGKVGSPISRIDKLTTSKHKEIEELEFDSFEIRK